MKIRAVSMLALLAALGVCGCSVVKENAGSCPIPPSKKVEITPKPPVSEDPQIFQPGYWDWDGQNYTWREGKWIKKDGKSGQWQDGYWDRDKVPGPCNWYPAHWL